MQKKLMNDASYPDGSSNWRIACDCHDPNHDVNLWFEPDEDVDLLNLNLSMEIGFYPRYSWLEDKLERIKWAAKVLFTGYATMQGNVILDQVGIKAMQAALARGQANFKSAESKRANLRRKIAK